MDTHNTATATDARAALMARRDKVLADFCQLALDERSTPEGLSDDARAEMNALEEELAAIHQQLTEKQQAPAPAATATPGAYNGYANGDTYTVVRHISSSARASEIAAAIVAGAWSAAADRVAEDRAAIVAPRADAADALREWLEEENPLADAGGLFNDLVTHALARVDWGGVADHFAPNPLPSIEPLPDEPAEDDD